MKLAPGMLLAGFLVFLFASVFVGLILLLIGGVVFVVEKVKESE